MHATIATERRQTRSARVSRRGVVVDVAVAVAAVGGGSTATTCTWLATWPGLPMSTSLSMCPPSRGSPRCQGRRRRRQRSLRRQGTGWAVADGTLLLRRPCLSCLASPPARPCFLFSLSASRRWCLTAGAGAWFAQARRGRPNRTLCVVRDARAGRRPIGPGATNDATWSARPPRGVAVSGDTAREGRGWTGPSLGIWEKRSRSWWFLRRVVDPPGGRSGRSVDAGEAQRSQGRRSCAIGGRKRVAAGRQRSRGERCALLLSEWTDRIETAKGTVRERDVEGGDRIEELQRSGADRTK